MHALLLSQLRCHLGPEASVEGLAPDLQQLLKAVDHAYGEADARRTSLEHALNLASVELRHHDGRTPQEVQSQKLQAVGQLAAGVAHEINSPIQYIGDNVAFLRQSFLDLKALLKLFAQLPRESTLRQLAEKIELPWLLDEIPKAIEGTSEGIQRVAELVRALKDFAHPDSAEMTLIDLNHALRGTLIVAGNELKYVADVTTDFGAVPNLLCHGGSLNQVFLNLLVNAAHAVSASNRERPGKIKVTSRAEADAVVVTISDNGVGIPEANRCRIFEPSFTTRPNGKGNSQGLALALAIVEKHGGTLTFDSTVAVGTTFFVRLPITHLDEEREVA